MPPSDLATRTSLFKAGAQPLARMQQSAARGLANDPNGEAAQRTGTALGKVLTREQAEAAGIVDKQTMPPGVSIDQNIKLCTRVAVRMMGNVLVGNNAPATHGADVFSAGSLIEIGRASCRERV